MTQRLAEQQITLEFTDAAKDKVVEEGYDPEYGARPLRRALQRHVEDPLAELLLRKEVKEGSRIVIRVKEGELFISNETEMNVTP